MAAGPRGSANPNGNYNGRLNVGFGSNPATINGQSIFNSGFAGFSFNGSSSLSSLSGLQGVGTGSAFARFTFGGSSSLSSLTGIQGVGFNSGFARFVDPQPRGLTTAPYQNPNFAPWQNPNNDPRGPNPPGPGPGGAGGGGGAAGAGGDPGLPGDPGSPTPHACGVFNGSHQILPLIGEDMAPDSRYAALSPKSPQGDGIPAFAKGIFGLVVSATNEEKQIEYFFPSWTGQLISVNQAGDPRMGTLVCDLTSGFSVDASRTSPLQSMIRVIKKPLGAENALAWNIDKTGCGDTRGGFVGERPEGGGEEDYAFGLASYSDGGPLCVGSKTDKHRKGLDDDKHVINSLHIKTAALFRLNDVEDGPLRFERPYKIGTEFEQPVAVHLAWTGEDWAWYTTSPLRYVTVTHTITPQLPSLSEPTGYPKVNLTPVSPTSHPSVPSIDPRTLSPGEITSGSVGAAPIQSAVSNMPLTAPAMVAQAQNYRPGQLNTGMFAGNSEAGSAKGAASNPVSAVMSAFGAQGGTPAAGGSAPVAGTGAQGDPWVYTNPPVGQSFGSNAPSNFPSGTSSGGWVIHPPETDLRDAAPHGMVPPNKTLSTTYLITAPNAWFGAGTPELVTGSIRSGYSWGMDSSTGDLLFRSHSFSEPAVNAVRFTNTAQTIQWYATKSFYGELSHSNTGNRTYTFPDRTGPVGLMLTGTGSPDGSVSAPESTMYWDTSGNALYVNNDGATAWTAIAGGGGGTVTGSGAAGRVAYWTSASNISSDAGLTYDAANDSLTITSASAPLQINVSGATGVVGYASTAAASASNVLDISTSFVSSLGGSTTTAVMEWGVTANTAQTGIWTMNVISAGAIAARLKIQGAQVLVNSGSVTAPGLGWISDGESGWYLIGTDNIGASINQTLVYDWNATRLKFAESYYVGIGTDTRSFTTDLLVMKHTTASVTTGMLTDLNTGYAAYTAKSNDGNHMQFGIVNNAYVSPSTPITAGSAICGLSNATLPGVARDLWIYNDLAGPIVFATNQVPRARILSTGLFGINTANPRRFLDVLDTGGPQMRLTYTDNSVYSDHQVNSNGNYTITPTGTTVFINKDGGSTVGGLTEGQLHLLASTTTDDLIEAITFSAHSSTGAANYTRAQAGIYVQGGNSYGTRMYFGTSNLFANGAVTRLQIDQNGGLITTPAASGHSVFNEDGVDADLRVEGDTNTSLLHVDASADTVQINSATTADSAKFYVNGKISTSGELEVNGDFNHDGSNFAVFNTAGAGQGAHIVDADGTLADITTKFNTLLARIEGWGFNANA